MRLCQLSEDGFAGHKCAELHARTSFVNTHGQGGLREVETVASDNNARLETPVPTAGILEHASKVLHAFQVLEAIRQQMLRISVRQSKLSSVPIGELEPEAACYNLRESRYLLMLAAAEGNSLALGIKLPGPMPYEKRFAYGAKRNNEATHFCKVNTIHLGIEAVKCCGLDGQTV